MSLQDGNTITQSGQAFAAIWQDWLRPLGGVAYPGGGPGGVINRKMLRQNAIQAAITQFGNFLPAITPAWSNLGPRALGHFDWRTWTLTLNNMWCAQDDITYSDFIELCATAYHETRHAEQVYRAAQGLAAGPPAGFAPPDVTGAEMIDLASPSATTIQDKIALFSGGGATSATGRTKVIEKLLGVQATVATHADNNRAGFAVFTALAKPNWFKRATARLEAEEWMRLLAKQTLGGLTAWVERNPLQSQRVTSMYFNLPVEVDAYGIEAQLVSAIEAATGHLRSADGGAGRTNTVLFGV